MADVNSDLVPVWARVVERLVDDPDIGEMDKQWVERTQPMWMMHDTALLAAPNERAKQVLEGRLLPQLTEALSRELGRPVRIAVMVDANAMPTMPAPAAQAPAEPYPGPSGHDEPDDRQRHDERQRHDDRHRQDDRPRQDERHGQDEGHYGGPGYPRPYESDYDRPRYDTGGYEQRPAPYGGGPAAKPGLARLPGAAARLPRARRADGPALAEGPAAVLDHPGRPLRRRLRPRPRRAPADRHAAAAARAAAPAGAPRTRLRPSAPPTGRRYRGSPAARRAARRMGPARTSPPPG